MLEPVLIGHCEELYHAGDVRIAPDVRRKHMAMFGTTGAGKSTLMRNMIGSDIAGGMGVTVVDPHGQLVEDVLNNHIPRWRTDDVIYFNPKDLERATPINLLYSPSPEFNDLVVDNAVSIFQQLWPDAFAVGARMEDIFENTFHALVEHPAPASLWNVPRFLTDRAYRAVILRKVNTLTVRKFFENEFDSWTPAFREQAISPVLNKCRPFLNDARMRAVIGSAHTTFRFRSVIDEKKILLCDLSKGAIGQGNAQLLGSLIVMQEKLAALSRYDIPEEDRVSHMLYVEEAHNFIADFESILTETRKFNLHLVLATQGIDQLSKQAAAAVFNCCATLAAFRVSSADAQRLRDEFAMLFPAEVLHDLPDYQAYVRTLETDDRGVNYPADPRCVTTYPPLPKSEGNADPARVIRRSVERWTKPRAELEARLARFLERKFKETANGTR